MEPPASPGRPALIVLVADDDDDMRSLVRETLDAHGCTTLEARDGGELLEMLRDAVEEPTLRPDILVTDVKMPRLSGLGVLDALRKVRLDLPVIVMTVVSDESIHSVARSLGAVGVLRKPFEPRDLLEAVQSAHAAHARDEKLRSSRGSRS